MGRHDAGKSDGNNFRFEYPAVTRLIAEASRNSASADALLKLLYAQLRAAAGQQMHAERSSHTLSATALVHEAYLKLVGPREVPWQDRAQFYAAAVEAMRRVLLDHAKARGRIKRGGVGEKESAEFLALDDAICRLKEKDERSAEVVRLRYFCGLSVAETAALLGVSQRTVKGDWAFAKAWLRKQLR